MTGEKEIPEGENIEEFVTKEDSLVRMTQEEK